MIGKRLGGVVLVLLGIGAIAVGLLFLLGAAGKTSRYAVAVISLALGAVLAGVGIRLFKVAAAASPEQLRAELLALAGRHGGELSPAQLAAALGQRAALAAPVLATLEAEGLCQREARGAGFAHIFPGLQARLVVRRCAFCDAEVSISETATECPRCGGLLSSGTAARPDAADAYRMDDE